MLLQLVSAGLGMRHHQLRVVPQQCLLLRVLLTSKVLWLLGRSSHRLVMLTLMMLTRQALLLLQRQHPRNVGTRVLL